MHHLLPLSDQRDETEADQVSDQKRVLWWGPDYLVGNGLTDDERASARAQRNEQLYNAGRFAAIALRLDDALTISQCKYEKASADCVELAGRIPNAEKMENRALKAEQERDYWIAQMGKLFRNLPQKMLNEIREQSLQYHDTTTDSPCCACGYSHRPLEEIIGQ